MCVIHSDVCANDVCHSCKKNICFKCRNYGFKPPQRTTSYHCSEKCVNDSKNKHDQAEVDQCCKVCCAIIGFSVMVVVVIAIAVSASDDSSSTDDYY